MQDGDLSIGDLARRTGLTVTAIRFYADHGIIPTSGRSSAGHRRFGADAVARLVIVRALRGLGVDLPTIRRVLAREVSMAAAAADRLPVLDRQIRSLQQQRAALSLLAQQHVRDEGVDAVQHDSVPNTDDADRLMNDFFDRVLRNIDAGPEWVGIVRSMTPVLPADPAAEQALAWVELVEMLQDNDFRELIRVIAESFAAERAATRAGPPRRDAVTRVRDRVRPVLAAGVEPTSPDALAVIDALAAGYASAVGRRDDDDLRLDLMHHLATVNDPRRDAYFRRLSVVNGWPPPSDLGPELDWTVRALRARIPA
jgi:DNA-binding transcriptional MerR regulator